MYSFQQSRQGQPLRAIQTAKPVPTAEFGGVASDADLPRQHPDRPLIERPLNDNKLLINML